LRSFRDRDYLLTPEGFIFTVIGNLHPADRVIAYLKYVPDEGGRWGRGRSRYRRALEHYNVPSVMESMRFLREKAPQYVFESTVDGISLPGVPKDGIVQHFCPEVRLVELQGAQNRDELESKALRLAELISEKAGVPIGSLGLTGSILAGIHDPAFSDIDLVVYGFDNALHVKTILQMMKDSSSAAIRRLAGAYQKKWIAERLKSTPLTRRDIVALFERKWNIGQFCETAFSIHAVHLESEISDRYGDERYVPLGIVDTTGIVVDATESLFMPAVYRVASTRLEGVFSGLAIGKIVSYEGLYSDIARKGEMISCRGKLERVESPSGLGYRIVVGSPEARGTDFIVLFNHF
jgi:predicted nucleotidyltransferase